MRYCAPCLPHNLFCCSCSLITACIVGSSAAITAVLIPCKTVVERERVVLCRHAIAVPLKRRLWLPVQGRARLCCQVLLTFVALTEAAPRLFQVRIWRHQSQLQVHYTAPISRCRVVGSAWLSPELLQALPVISWTTTVNAGVTFNASKPL